MLIIDADNQLNIIEYEKQKEELMRQKGEKGIYEIDDFAMIRTTNFLDEDLVLKAVCDVPLVINTENVARSAIYNLLVKEYNINIYNDEQQDFLREKLNQFSPLSTQYRSTIHFTLNGLVSNHSKGTFDNQNFIIIDKLNQHLGKDDFRSIRMEDSFVFEKFPLSSDATILINYDKYEELTRDRPWLLDMKNVILFKGDEKIATEMVLTSMGIIPEKIETHSAEITERTPMYQKFFDTVKEKYGIEQTKHYYSEEYQLDDEKSLKLWKIYDTQFYTELFDYFKVDETNKAKMIEFLNSNIINRVDQQKMLTDFILQVGLENYKNFVLLYNGEILKNISDGIYPTNKMILNSGKIELNNNSIKK